MAEDSHVCQAGELQIVYFSRSSGIIQACSFKSNRVSKIRSIASAGIGLLK